jgi:hypothetical protein
MGKLWLGEEHVINIPEFSIDNHSETVKKQNKMPPNTDSVNTELIRHALLSLLQRLLKFIQCLFKINKIAEAVFSEWQHSFREEWSCIDCTFTVIQVTRKHRDLIILIFIAFINWSKLWEIKEKCLPKLFLTLKTSDTTTQL